MNLNRLYSFATAAIAAATLAVSAHAALLSGNEVQLETWLGQGDLDFTNIFTKQAGDDSGDFHTAADGKGATFTLFQAYTYNLETEKYDIGHLLGGYNPQSWNSSANGNLTPNDPERTAFIYDLTRSTIQRQNLIGYGDADSGQYQTYNHPQFGSFFGKDLYLFEDFYRFDLFVRDELDEGASYNYSYGGTSLETNITGALFGTGFQVTEFEVYTVASATTSVPDTAGTFVLLSISLLGLVCYRRRFAS
jgi:hypothetical protein